MTRVLVAYASAYGSVEEVARYVGAVMRDREAECDVVTARDRGELEGYDLVVLGTGLYMARVHRDARRFLCTHHEELEHVPFAVFGMGPLSGDHDEREKVRPQLDRALTRFPAIHPIATEIFGGVIDPERMPFPFSRMPAGDHRDWDEILEFALSLSAKIPIAA